MRGKPVSKKEIQKIEQLRKTGHSLPEICRVLKRRKSTVHGYAKDVVVLPEYINILRQKQGGSAARAEKFWNKARFNAKKLLRKIGKREKLFILAAIYWGEGAKKEFNLINSDPALIQVSLSCLREIGVKEKDLRITLRVYEGINIEDAKKYWSKICKVNSRNIKNVNVLEGNKIGKLPYGMCRIRITKGG